MKILTILIPILFSFMNPALAQDAPVSLDSVSPESPSPTPKEVLGAEVIFPKKEEIEAKPLFWMCRASSLVRTIKVEWKSGSCRTTYNKDGVDRDSGQSKELGHCFQVFKNIKKNLESNSWTCKDISNAPVVVNE